MKREQAAPRSVAGWLAKGAAKLKFLRSSDDAATHKKFKRFILVGEARVAARALPFSQYKLSFLALALSIDYQSFSTRPDTTQLYNPLPPVPFA